MPLPYTPLPTIDLIHKNQKLFFKTDATLPYQYRYSRLNKLEIVIKKNEQNIIDAINNDFKKPATELITSETGIVLSELSYAKRNLKKWMRDQKVPTPLLHFPASSYVQKIPKGQVLIISPWNYPFQLNVSPLIGAIAAGNVAIIKPSEHAPHTAEILRHIIHEVFEEQECAVILGGVEETTHLLEKHFDHIFYTGNRDVAKIILEKVAKHLTPVTLELGGKSPCLLCEDANLDISVKRILWGKVYNTGQSCVAPDYVLVPRKLKEIFISLFHKHVVRFFGTEIQKSDDLGRIINDRHFERLEKLLHSGRLLYGGKTDKNSLFIEPTLIEANANDSIMHEEVFGPILPVIFYDSIEEAYETIDKNRHPLAAFIFTHDEHEKCRFLQNVSSGGVTINDTLIHFTSRYLPFGGIGESGFGTYRGKYTFNTFSHDRAIIRRSFYLDFFFRYPPYKIPLYLFKKLLKLL